MNVDDVIALVQERYEAADPFNLPLTGKNAWNSGYRAALAGVIDDIRNFAQQEAWENDQDDWDATSGDDVIDRVVVYRSQAEIALEDFHASLDEAPVGSTLIHRATAYLGHNGRWYQKQKDWLWHYQGRNDPEEAYEPDRFLTPDLYDLVLKGPNE